MQLASWSLVVAFFASATSLCAGVATAYQDATHLYLENDVLKIALWRNTGGLDGIIHKQSGVNLQSNTTNADKGIWFMMLNTSAGNACYKNGRATSFTGQLMTDVNSASLVLTWKGLLQAGCGGSDLPGATVRARITVRTDSPLSYWAFETEGLGTNSVTWIHFPDINGIDKLGLSGADDVLLVPQEKGILHHNPTANLTSVAGNRYPSGYQSMQFISFLDPTSGFYFASDDTQGNAKAFYWTKTAGAAGSQLAMESTPGGPAADKVTVPYNMIVGVTEGDWYAPAEIYRKWAVQQPWVQQSRTKKVPAWLHDMGLSRSGWGYGIAANPDQSFADFARQFQQSQQTFGSPGMALLWGWEKYGAWVEGDYFPPKEGWSAFDAMVQSIRPGKVWLMPSALILDTATDLYRAGTMKSSAMLDQQGKERTTASGGQDTGRWVFMDISTNPWRQYMVDTFQTLARHGVDLIQLDSSMVFGPQDCYNPAHLHPPGSGGNWQTLAWIDITQRIAAAVATENPGATLAAEEPAEIYLPYLSLFYSGAPIDLFEEPFPDPNMEPVPLFQYVYHDSIIFADFFNGPDLDGSYFRLVLARDLTWGQLPDYNLNPNNNSPLKPVAAAYLQSAIVARTTYARKFLIDGIMLPAPRLNVPLTSVTRIVWSEGGRQVTSQQPSIFESAWRAGDGSTGIVLTNIAPGSVTFSLPISYSRLGLPAGATYTVQAIGDSSSTSLDANMTKDASYSITLASQQILLVTLTQKAAGSPASVAAAMGDGQATTINTPFPIALQATVRDSNKAPVSGVTVTFTATPSVSGPGGSFANTASSATSTTDSAGIATAPAFTANAAAGGPYRVTASVAGLSTQAGFALTNVNPAPRILNVVNAEGGNPRIAPNTWVEIDGTNLVPPGDSRVWAGADFVSGQLPAQLDGVNVTFNGKAAYVYYISPTQVNVLTPPDAMQGEVQVQLTSAGFTSGTSVTAQQVSPSLFVINGGPYVLATHADGSIIGPTSLYPGLTTPARPGETIVVYGNGFGATSPAVVSGSTGQSGKLPTNPIFRIGGNPATVLFAGVVSPGLYQFNVVVSSSTADGDQTMTVTYNGVATQSGTLVTVQTQ